MSGFTPNLKVVQGGTQPDLSATEYTAFIAWKTAERSSVRALRDYQHAADLGLPTVNALDERRSKLSTQARWALEKLKEVIRG